MKTDRECEPSDVQVRGKMRQPVTHRHSRVCWTNRVHEYLRSIKVQWLLGPMILTTAVACSPRIVAEGVHETLPTQGTRIGVWGAHPTLEHTAILWLGKRGLRVVDPAEIRVHLSGANNATLIVEEKSILEVAEKYDLQEMVFVRLVGDQRAPAVLVRALTLPERQVAWVGSARYEEYLSEPTVNHLVVAVCQALAAAWKIPALSHNERCILDEEG